MGRRLRVARLANEASQHQLIPQPRLLSSKLLLLSLACH
jgi:hypothetical protein